MTSDSNKEIVFIMTMEENSKLHKLNLNDKLPDIRKELENYNLINDMFSFSKKNSQKMNDYSEIVCEESFDLKDIIDNSESQNTLYLIKSSRPSWNTLNEKFELDYGRTMTFDGIKKANKKAFIMKNCILTVLGAKGLKKDTLKFQSKEDWMKKTNLFVEADGIDIMNFVKLGLSVGSSRFENFNAEIKSTYQYTEFSKVLLEFSKDKDLEPTDEFTDTIEKAINSNDPEQFISIIEEYGRFIPTQVVLGGRVYIKDVEISEENSVTKSIDGEFKIKLEPSKFVVNSSTIQSTSEFYKFNRNHMRLLGGIHPEDENFNEKTWIESLKNYDNWECIEYRNPIHIFKLLPKEFCKRIYEIIGKKVLYSNIVDHHFKHGKVNETKTLPYNVSKIFQYKPDCRIFATVIDTQNSNNVFNCQILHPSGEIPKILIHRIQIKSMYSFQTRRKFKLKIGLMIIGYDTDFNTIFSDINVQLIEKLYDSNNPHTLKLEIERDLNSMNIFVGIPVLSKLERSFESLVIGHHFFKYQDNDKIGVNIFSYCLKNNQCSIKLPNFTFYTLMISNSHNDKEFGTIPFKKQLIDLEKFDRESYQNPKYISLYSENENNYGLIFSKRVSKKIKIKFIECKCKDCENKTKISEGNIECKFIDPYRR
ncbi:14757_t:CDS:1 [Funneliformis mosseae]|uniref:14757_t:CDS:1 n=1 Tax=Funneliformis mosseae TaxID=27381 RepID=A0A9N9CDW1_FUNMO|nr:14757_t:CDS:1 [Funneliformis mosseae]